MIPRPGYSTRMRAYLAEMHPLPSRLAGAALLALSFLALLRHIHGIDCCWITPYVALGVWNLFALTLVLRLMDELKDKDVDLALFRDRPLPSGRVEEADIVFSLWIAVALYLAPNLWTPGAALPALAPLAWAALMFRWFFIPRIMKPNLPLTLATHNPVVPLLLLDLVALFAAEHGIPLARLRWGDGLLLVLMYWSMSFAWEIARKIRSPEEENDYVTYSRLLGAPGATALAAAAQGLTFVIGLYLWRRLALSWTFPAILAVAYAATLAAHARFLRRPGPATSRLKPPAERYAVGVMIAALAGCALGR